ncbi:hypothetical protein HXA31_20385 [Salipaludibacillus agaradhaerens]|uniref:Uncharacterized protein n=1 Tax=Salipaludibacillus agaradhaerens TaxID=76935 RepID=A0A9Q4B1Y8_SALAG|nr:hypothetical protein [Salipaludibacillus agaradhaerens]MCR6096846.1 hypothetical protein [Salipaludibacillus agaradhaerens]MCR6116690.1 hypothetical protein [Salipaludibacillus agaradhaerens]
MTEQYRFFDPTENDDREYAADDFAQRYKLILSNGFFNGLSVSANDSMTVTLSSGAAFIEGYDYENRSNIDLNLDNADSTQDRIDRIVLRLDKFDGRYIRAFVKKGTTATNPEPPELTRDDYFYELSLAQIKVTAGKSYIDSSQITDERGNYSVCGRVGLSNRISDQITSVDVRTANAYPSEYGEGVNSFRMSGSETPEIFQGWLESLNVTPSDYGRELSQLRANVLTQSTRNETGVQQITIYDFSRNLDYRVYGQFTRSASALTNPLWGGWHEEVLVAEKGENENGKFIKYTNGEMKCWFENNETTSVQSQVGGTYWNNRQFSFPQPFVSRPYAQERVRRTSGTCWGGLRSANANSCDVYIFATSDNGAGFLGYVAEGRWR